MTTYRTVIEEERFKAEIEAFGYDPKRMDEFLGGTIWAICHQPILGRLTTVPGIMAIPIDGWATLIPDLVIYYKYDKNHVWLLSIIKAQEVEPDP